MSATVLIVDDSNISRRVLNKILSETYTVVEASDGHEALEMLDTLSPAAIILDLVMPGMDGFAFLREFAKREDGDRVPIVVSTEHSDAKTEVEVLKLGAWDFISKPYVPEIIMFRLRNAIIRSQLTAFQELKYRAEFDELTGIYNKNTFFDRTHEMLQANPNVGFSLVRFDIDRFHLVNAYYGRARGDELLRYLGQQLADHRFMFSMSTFCHVESDVFALCIPSQSKDDIEKVMHACVEALKNFDLSFDMVPTFGVCVITDPSLPVDELYDCASLAAKNHKGGYASNVGYYEDSMGENVEREQEIINDMASAIAEEQFEVWYQPKYDIRTNHPAGAEALVRWRHPVKGLVPPGLFVPVFERNGFVSELDYYVWEHACRDLHEWIEAGRNPNPVSVNISRVDLSDPALVDKILELTERYEVPHSLLNLELTESAYADNPQQVISVMEEFQNQGFVVMMDDFGSGQSSLNILKDINVNVLKIDMRFFVETTTAGRGESIVASVIRMAKWLRIPVIAEGVEEREQVDFLRGLGCEFVQGYYFAKPMPKAEYEQYVSGDTDHVEEEAATFDPNEVWRNGTFMSEITYPAAVFEYGDDHMEILRVNDGFYDLFGYEDKAEQFVDPMAVIDESFRKGFVSTFEKAVETGETEEYEYRRRMDGDRMAWIHARIRSVGETGGNHILYAIFSDITAAVKLEKSLDAHRNQLSRPPFYRRLLVVDDADMSREVLAAMFEDELEVLEASDGEEAWSMLEAEEGKVDVILLDMIMPELDGQGLLSRMKTDERFAEVPVIIISADDTEQQQTATMDMGADDYIVKPFVEGVVRKRVWNVLRAHGKI